MVYLLSGTTSAVEPGDALPTQVLHPVLDTYLNAAVAITGCHSYNIARSCCEYDVVIVSNESGSNSSVRTGDSFLDLFFMSEKEVLSPSETEVAVSLAYVKPVRDNSLVLTTGAAAAKAVLHENLRKSSEARLARSVKSLGRADDALSKNSTGDADFWLLSAAYEFSFAWLYSCGSAPAPSHLLEQLKGRSSASPGSYEAFSRAVGLENASKSSCAERLEALSVVYDAIDASDAGEGEDAGTRVNRTAFDIVRAKSDYLTRAIMHVDCYAFLGLEVCAALPLVAMVKSGGEATGIDQSRIVSSLSQGDQRMLGDRVVSGLGITREANAIGAGIEGLRTEISSLAKRI